MDLGTGLSRLGAAVPWEELGFIVDGRYLFSQRTLATVMLPDVFSELLDSRSQDGQKGTSCSFSCLWSVQG